MPRVNRELTYQDDQHDVVLVIEEATALSAMKRAIYQGRAQAHIEALEARVSEEGASFAGGTVGIQAQNIVAGVLYPDCLAAVAEAQGLDPDMDVPTFLSLPQGLTDAWQNLVYELNPHWYPFHSDAEKKDAEPSDNNSKSASDAS